MTKPPNSLYREVLDRARAELASARAEKFRLETKMARLERTVLALSSLVDEPTIDPAMGITEGVKAVLRAHAPNALFPTTIRVKLEEAGFDFSEQANPLASIHAILKRLVAKGVVEAFTPKGETRVSYNWREQPEGDDPSAYISTFDGLADLLEKNLTPKEGTKASGRKK